MKDKTKNNFDAIIVDKTENNTPEQLRANNDSLISLSLSPVANDSSSYLDPDPYLINIACANARSIVEKIKSLITLSEENHLHFAMITETWLNQKACPPRVMSDLTVGAELSFIRRDRGSRGGGVAISYNPTKIRLNKFNFVCAAGDKTELVCAVGNCSLTKRKIAAISIYLPPSLSKTELSKCVQTLTDCTDQLITKHPDCIIFIGGDFNKKDISTFMSTFPEIKPLLTGPTRRGAALDEIYTNVQERLECQHIQQPLSKEDGTVSDHHIIAASFKLPRAIKSTSSTFTFRPITTEGVEKFGRLLAQFDWALLQRETSTESAVALNDTLQSFVSDCFPLKSRTVRSSDAPWLDKKTKKMLAKKRRIYQQEGKSTRFKEYEKVCAIEVERAKKKYLDKIIAKCAQLRNTAGYYKAVGLLKTKSAPTVFDVTSMYPDKSDEEIGK